MISSGSLTRRLATQDPTIFEGLRHDLEGREKLEFSINLLMGLLEEDLPYYYLSDLPNHTQLIKQRSRLKAKALRFAEENIATLLTLLDDKKALTAQRESLFYLLAKYLPKMSLSLREHLRFILITLELAREGFAGKLPAQALCRYDLAPLAQSCALTIDCSGKAPYPELLKRLREAGDEYARLYLLLTREARILYLQQHERLPDYKPELVESLLSSLSLANPEALRTALEHCAKRPDPLETSGRSKSDRRSISQEQTITQTMNKRLKDS